MNLTDKDNENSMMTNSTTNDEDVQPKSSSDKKEDFEERYYKFKGFALKLKKKVNDLTDELRLSESEKNKAIAEKEEYQKKISQVSDNIKKLQTIQLEYDKLQDSLEQQKNENKKLIKNLEVLVVDNTTLKQSHYDLKENIVQLTSDLENRTKEIAELKVALKKKQGTLKSLEEAKKADVLIREQREKDYENIKLKLEDEILSHKNTQIQLDIAKQECSSNNVLCLEVDNYVKSIDDLKSKLNDESSKCSILEGTVEEQRQIISDLKMQLAEMKNSCLTKTNQLTTLGEKNENLKAELNDLRQEILQITNEKQSLVDAMAAIKLNADKLANESISHVAEKKKIIDDMESQSKSHLHQVEILQLEISRLNASVNSTLEEMEALKNEYEGYKLRAQSVLRTKKSQNKELGLNGRSINEVEADLSHLHSKLSQLREKFDQSSDEIKTLTDELTLVKEERDFARKTARDLGNKLTTLTQDYANLREQCRGQLITIEQLREEVEVTQENLQKIHTTEITSMKEKHQREIDNLQMELQKMTMNSSLYSRNLNEKSMEMKSSEHEGQTRNEIYLLEREDGEGSESVESYTAGNFTVERQKPHSLMPLDELLNSSDDFPKPNIPAKVLPTKVDRYELEVCERRVKHLTILLADAERDIAKLNEMNQLLKEDIRRQQRSVEREHHANNFEYLKNIVMKFITLKNGDERTRLIPVLNTILKLSPAETVQLNQAAGGI
ncbi:hypothetical protein PV327_002234 [Microctonus hyperodae]|uniref:GRIP domain-containing protein n=1 Tax=Microctonus hyperodae TaxID=165561 RepID=A0AA39FF58_MICHY|nr:hypothetical protein PV327_002234 [Microctonus hyperodae]